MVENLTSRAEMDQFLLESVINTMPIFIYWKDVNLIYMGCNKHYATINGFEITSDIIGKIDENLLWANYRLEEIQRSDRRVLKNNVPEYNIIESWILPNGNEVIYNTNRIPIRNSEGNVIGILTTYEDITEKIFLERRLKESEERYRLITENANDMIYTFDDKFRLEYLNKATKEIMGLSKDDLIGRFPAEFVHPEDVNLALTTLKRGFQEGYTESVEIRVKDNRDNYHWIDSKSSTFKESDGKLKVIIIAREITERKAIEQRLAESEVKFRDITELLPETLFEANLQSFITYVNPPGLEKFGITMEDIESGINAFEFFARDNEREHAINNMKKVLLGNDVGVNEYLFKTKDGTEFYGLVHSRPTYKDDKITGIRGIIIDIDESKKSQILIKSEKKKLEYIMGSMIDGLCVNDVDGTITEVNKPFFEMFGLNSPKEIIGRAFFDLVPKREVQRITKRFMDTINKKEPFIKNFEVGCQRKDGTEFPVMFNIRNLWDSKGKFISSISVARDITELKKAEQKLRESEEKNRLFLQNFQGIAYQSERLSFKPIHFHGTVEEITGYSVKDFIERKITWDKLVHPDDLPKIIQEGERQKSNPEYIVNVVYRIIHRNGEYKWVNDITRTIYDDKRKNSFIQGAIYDITERIKAEQKLKESELKYRHLFNTTPYAIWLVDLKGKIIDCNDTMNNFMSVFKKEDLIGKTFREIIKIFLSKGDPRFANLEQSFRERFKILLKQGYLEPIEFEISRGDGKTYWVTLETSIVKVGKESFIEVFIKDITERKEAELKLKKSEEDLRVFNKELEIKVQERTRELRQSEKKFRTIFESIPDFFFLVSDDSTIVDYRGKEEDLYMPPEELMGKKLINIMPPEIGKETQKMINETIYTRKPQNMEYNLQIKKRTHFFEARFLFFTGKMVAIFARNITHRKEAEIELNKSREKLKQQNIELIRLDKAKDDFISMAAHELKTPLISISGYTDYVLTKHKDELSIDIKSDLEIVQRNIARLQRIINQLLDVIKIESLKIDLSIERINISEVIYRCLHELGYLFKEKDHEMVLNVDNEIFLNIDPDRMFQVFSNLISNAVKFTPKGGRIEISAKKEENRYLFEVIDSGIGISKDQIPRLFKKFERAQQESDEDIQTGTGLGLYISKGFIHAHGGEMWATSPGKNKGITICFTIPY